MGVDCVVHYIKKNLYRSLLGGVYTYNIPSLNFKGGRHFLHWKKGMSLSVFYHCICECRSFKPPSCYLPTFRLPYASVSRLCRLLEFYPKGASFQWLRCFYLMTGHLLGGKRLITWASLLASLHLAATLSSSVLFLPPKATLQPSLDNKRTAPRPIPELPPKTYLLVLVLWLNHMIEKWSFE